MQCASCRRADAPLQSKQLARAFCDARCRDAYSLRTGRFIRTPGGDALLVPQRYFGPALDDTDERMPSRRYAVALLRSPIADDAQPLRAYYVVPVAAAQLVNDSLPQHNGPQHIGPQTKRTQTASTRQDEPVKRPAVAAEEEQLSAAAEESSLHSDEATDTSSSSSSTAPAPTVSYLPLHPTEETDDTLSESYADMLKMRTLAAGLRQLPRRYDTVYECAAYCVTAMSVAVHDIQHGDDAVAKTMDGAIARLLPLLAAIYRYVGLLRVAFSISADDQNSVLRLGAALAAKYRRRTTADTGETLAVTVVFALNDIVDEALDVLTAYKDVRLLMERIASLDRMTKRIMRVSLFDAKSLHYRILPRMAFDPALPLRVVGDPKTVLLSCVGPIELNEMFLLHSVIGRGAESVVLRVSMLQGSRDVALSEQYALKITDARSAEPQVYRVVQQAAAPQVNMVRMLFASRWLLLRKLRDYVDRPSQPMKLHILNYDARLFTVMLLERADSGTLQNLVHKIYKTYELQYYVEKATLRFKSTVEILDAVQQSAELYYTLQMHVRCMVAQFRMQFVALRQLFGEFHIGDLHGSNVLVFHERLYSTLVYVLRFPVRIRLREPISEAEDLDAVHLIVVPLKFTDHSVLKITDMGAATISYRMADQYNATEVLRGLPLTGDKATSPAELIELLLFHGRPLAAADERYMQLLFAEMFAAPDVHAPESDFYAPLTVRVQTQLELDIERVAAERDARYLERMETKPEKAPTTLAYYNDLIRTMYKQHKAAGFPGPAVPDTDVLERYALAKLQEIERLAGVPPRTLQQGRLLWIRLLGERAAPIAQVRNEIKV